MQFREVYDTLKKQGTAQNVKIYQRHGAGKKLFGVSFANLNVLKKKIKTDHKLAQSLWKTKNMDAQCLALMIADPDEFTMKEADLWLSEIQYHLLSNLLGTLVAKTPFATKAVSKWCRSKKEFYKHCGYDVFSTLIKNGHSFTKIEVRKILKTIEKEIHGSPNRARSAMNAALIGIGVYCDGMKTEAIASAKKIGPVEVDHGDTSCKTPEAVSYIEKSYAHHHRKKKTKKKSKSK